MSKRWLRATMFSILAVAVVGLAWGQSSIKVMTSNGISYLATSQGMTLYYFTKDVNGTSACAGRCAKLWPPFEASNASAQGVQASDFGSFTRASGATQVTYDGWPLYTFSGDKSPGQMHGQGFYGVWYVATVPFYTVTLADSAHGEYLANADGRTLYYFTKDSADKSVCAGICAKLWPPFDVSSIDVPSALKASDFSTITRPDGTQQVAFEGHPLYYFSGDRQRGVMHGEGFKKIWYVIDPAKIKPLADPQSTPAASASSTSSSSGSGW